MAIEDIFHEALDEFLLREFSLVDKDAHEQSLCGRLAIYLDHAKDRHGFKAYYVDVEYNRNGEGRKYILHPVTREEINVTCDILLHSRGGLQDDNLVAIEMKKDDAKPGHKQRDRERLQALTTPAPERGNPDYVCGYELGFYLEVDIGRATLLIEEYRKGKRTDRMTKEFARP